MTLPSIKADSPFTVYVIGILLAVLTAGANAVSNGALAFPSLPAPYAAAIVGLVVFLAGIIISSVKQVQGEIVSGEPLDHAIRAGLIAFVTAVLVAAQHGGLPFLSGLDPNIAGTFVAFLTFGATVWLHSIGAPVPNPEQPATPATPAA